MKLLSDLLYRVRIEDVIGSTNIAIEHLTADSRTVRPMSLFIAVKGTRTDGHDHISAAIESGAEAILCTVFPEYITAGITYIKCLSTAHDMGIVAANFMDNPSEKLKVVAVTGTNGKTTTATLLYDLATGLGYAAGLLSTAGNRINGTFSEATHTTPDAIALQHMLAEMVDSGCDFCFMEASSHAIDQHRIAGIDLAGAIYTNLTVDHLDYHGTMENYFESKKRLFDGLSAKAFAIINTDDPNGERMTADTKAKILSYGLSGSVDYKATILENEPDGLRLSLHGVPFHARLVGKFNAYNLLAAFAAGLQIGFDRDEMLPVLSALSPAEGRFAVLRSPGGVMAIVDYAHTPDALENVLDTIAEFKTGNEQIITVVGCGGDRDRSKRPLMAAAAAMRSTKLILTSDNPRSEQPEAIIEEMKAGLDPVQLRKAFVIVNRDEAIKLSVSLASAGDIILVAGKGHEKYQETAGKREPFDDKAVVSHYFKFFEK